MFTNRYLVLAALAAASAVGQVSPSATWAITAPTRIQVRSGITYLTTNNYESKLDVYSRRDTPGPHPTLIYMHGGGWDLRRQRRRDHAHDAVA
jgi:acetyl esterase/lipase